MPLSTAYRTSYSYDLNGNIVSLDRRNGNGVVFDQLEYHYLQVGNTSNNTIDDYQIDPVSFDHYGLNVGNHFTNRLGWVDDEPTLDNVETADIDDQDDFNYTYDEIGQLTSDAKEDIESIVWSVSGKVLNVRRIAGSTRSDLLFKYDALGQRIAKIVIPRTSTGPKPQSEWTYTIYVRDAQGNTMATYERSFSACGEIDWKEQISLQEQYIYGSARLGLRHGLENVSMCFHVNDPAVLQDGYQLFTNPDYESSTLVYSEDKSNLDLLPYEKSVILVSIKTYEFIDHLGNVSATISDRKITIAVAAGNAVASYSPEILSQQDYFPFGMGMMGRSMTAANYKYGFNGKEDDEEWGFQDYGFRLYNPSIAKFISVDPLTKDYPWYTPYQFAGNKPIWAVDLDGLEEFIRTDWFVIGASGATLWKTEIQVVKAGENHTAVQQVHQNVNIVDPLGNVSTRYIGTTVGTRNPTNAANGSTAFNANENAAIWNSIPLGPGSNVSLVTEPNQGSGQIESHTEQPPLGGVGVQRSVSTSPLQPEGMVVIVQNPGVAPAVMADVPSGLHNTPANPTQRFNITDPGAPIPSLLTGAPLENGRNSGQILVDTTVMNKPTLRPVGTGQQKTMNSPTPGIPLILRDRRGLSLTIN